MKIFILGKKVQKKKILKRLLIIIMEIKKKLKKVKNSKIGLKKNKQLKSYNIRIIRLLIYDVNKILKIR